MPVLHIYGITRKAGPLLFWHQADDFAVTGSLLHEAFEVLANPQPEHRHSKMGVAVVSGERLSDNLESLPSFLNISDWERSVVDEK